MQAPSDLATCDVVVVGGGVVGTAILYTLSQYKLNLVLVEKNAEIGWGATKANSGIVHAGFHDDPKTWKGKLCIRGNQAYPELCQKLDVQFKQNGILMVAMSDEEMKTLHKYLERGKTNQVPGLRLLSKEEVLAKEPNLSENIVGALYAPEGGVVNPFEMAIAMSEVAAKNGAQILTETTVTGISRENDYVLLETNKGRIRARYVINAAGLWSDNLARMAGDNSFNIVPRKGEEYLFDQRVGDIVTNTIFPTPTPTSKGILAIPTAEGNLMIGPTALELPDREATDTSAPGFDEIFSFVTKLVNGLSPRDIITSFAGIRAASDRGDFIIEHCPTLPGLIHTAGIESPGLTAAPAIAETVANLLSETGLELTPNPDATDRRDKVVRFHALSNEERRQRISEDPSFGKIICRCETVTEGEIVDAIRRGARTVDGVKFRTRAGMGRCQGGFCQPLVIAILARELGLDPTEVTKRGEGTNVLTSKLVKGLGDNPAPVSGAELTKEGLA